MYDKNTPHWVAYKEGYWDYRYGLEGSKKHPFSKPYSQGWREAQLQRQAREIEEGKSIYSSMAKYRQGGK